MVRLDSDGRLLRDSYGNTAQRDIVQFVEMRKYVLRAKKRSRFSKWFGIGNEADSVLRDRNAINLVKAELSEAVLFEVVNQIAGALGENGRPDPTGVTGYFPLHKIRPDNPPDYSIAPVIPELVEAY